MAQEIAVERNQMRVSGHRIADIMFEGRLEAVQPGFAGIFLEKSFG
jgi:hypothetical protein